VSQYQKGKNQEGKTNLALLEQEIVSGSGICLAICKSASRPRQITMPSSHHSVLYRPDALPAAQPTASKHSYNKKKTVNNLTDSKNKYPLRATDVSASSNTDLIHRRW